MTKATLSKALGADIPAVKQATQNVLASNNPTLVGERMRLGLTTRQTGPTIKLDTAGQNVPMPVPDRYKKPSTAVAKHTPPKFKTYKA